MTKILTALGAFALSATVPHVAHAMECCTDGTCECCKPDDSAADPAPETNHQH